MSSKFGQRPIGSDGSDFRHRQRIANHYKDSVINKFRLKFVLALHSLLVVLVFVKVLEDLLDQFSVDFGPLERLNVPSPHFWEYWWLTSAAPVALALYSLPRNNSALLRRAYYGFFLVALLPVAFGAGYSLPLLVKFVYEPDNVESLDKFMNFPMVVLEYAFYAVAFQIHVFTMYFSAQLIKAWQPATVSTVLRQNKALETTDKKID